SRVLPSPGQWWRLCLLSLLNIAAFQALLFIAAYRLPGGLAAVLGACQPLILLGLIWGLQRQRPALHKLTAALTAVTGMALLLLGPTDTWDVLGVLAAFGGAISMACGVFFAKRWQQQLPLLAFTGWQLTLGGLMLLPAALWIDPAITQLDMLEGLSYAYLSLCGALLAYVLWFRGIAKLAPVAISALALLSPLSAVALGWILLEQSLDTQALLGLAIVLISIATLQCNTNPLQTLRLTLPTTSKLPRRGISK
ncbi:MAG: EamA family transporter, partial [Pseudomonadales bacterium]